jgi:catechol 2,3-dioxygenase-like lactoylglutathione lyase family enzyme
MLNYITIGASDLDRAGVFYDAVLGALGAARTWRQGDWIAYGPPGAEASVYICKPENGQPVQAANGVTLGLRADSKAQVDALHAAALAHGGTCGGPPGPRPQYGEGFYIAYIRDPDGNKLSAMFKAA